MCNSNKYIGYMKIYIVKVLYYTERRNNGHSCQICMKQNVTRRRAIFDHFSLFNKD